MTREHYELLQAPEAAERCLAFGKKYTAFVATGAAALETALVSVGVGSGDEVLVPLEACYLVAASVVRVGAHPVFVDVGPRLVLGQEDLQGLVVGAKALIAVHTFGLPCDVGRLRAALSPKVRIIEDASLAFGMQSVSGPIGAHADAVVASLGAGKPIDLSEAGVVSSDTASLITLLDRRNAGSRMRPNPPLPYALGRRALAGLPQALARAKEDLVRRRQAAAFMITRLEALGFETWRPADGDTPCWSRLPVWATHSLKNAALTANRTLGTEIAQRPHDISVPDLPMFRGRSSRIGHGDRRDLERLLLLRTGPLEMVELWLDRLAMQLA